MGLHGTTVSEQIANSKDLFVSTQRNTPLYKYTNTNYCKCLHLQRPKPTPPTQHLRSSLFIFSVHKCSRHDVSQTGPLEVVPDSDLNHGRSALGLLEVGHAEKDPAGYARFGSPAKLCVPVSSFACLLDSPCLAASKSTKPQNAQKTDPKMLRMLLFLCQRPLRAQSPSCLGSAN